MVWNLYNKNKQKQAAATWTTACDCAVAFQPDSCGGSEPLSWLWCRDTFAPLHLCHESRRLPRAPAHVSSPTFHPPTLTHTK